MKFSTPLRQQSNTKRNQRKYWDDSSFSTRSLRFNSSRRRFFIILFFTFCLLTCFTFSFSLVDIFNHLKNSKFIRSPSKKHESNSNVKRVAVCLTGGLRAFELTAPSLKFYLLSAYENTDVFVVTPKDNDTHKVWLLSGIPVVSVTIVDLIEFPLDDVMYRVIANHSSSSGRFGLMLYASLVERCCTAIERYEIIHKMKYDWVIRTRPDGLWFDFPPLLDQLSSEKFHVPDGNDWYGVNDRLSIANRDVGLDTMRWVTSLPQHYQNQQFALTAEPKLLNLLINLDLYTKINRVSFSFCILTKHTFHYPLYWHNDSRLSSAIAPLNAEGDGNGRYCKPCLPQTDVPLPQNELKYKYGTNLVCNGSDPLWPTNWEEIFDKAVGERFANERKMFQKKSTYWNCVQFLDQFFLKVFSIQGEIDPYKLCYLGYQDARANFSDPVESYVIVDV